MLLESISKLKSILKLKEFGTVTDGLQDYDYNLFPLLDCIVADCISDFIKIVTSPIFWFIPKFNLNCPKKSATLTVESVRYTILCDCLFKVLVQIRTAVFYLFLEHPLQVQNYCILIGYLIDSGLL